MSTDDAYVKDRKLDISMHVAGIVSQEEVTDNQHVVAGQVRRRSSFEGFE